MTTHKWLHGEIDKDKFEEGDLPPKNKNVAPSAGSEIDPEQLRIAIGYIQKNLLKPLTQLPLFSMSPNKKAIRALAKKLDANLTDIWLQNKELDYRDYEKALQAISEIMTEAQGAPKTELDGSVTPGKALKANNAWTEKFQRNMQEALLTVYNHKRYNHIFDDKVTKPSQLFFRTPSRTLEGALAGAMMAPKKALGMISKAFAEQSPAEAELKRYIKQLKTQENLWSSAEKVENKKYTLKDFEHDIGKIDKSTLSPDTVKILDLIKAMKPNEECGIVYVWSGGPNPYGHVMFKMGDQGYVHVNELNGCPKFYSNEQMQYYLQEGKYTISGIERVEFKNEEAFNQMKGRLYEAAVTDWIWNPLVNNMYTQGEKGELTKEEIAEKAKQHRDQGYRGNCMVFAKWLGGCEISKQEFRPSVSKGWTPLELLLPKGVLQSATKKTVIEAEPTTKVEIKKEETTSMILAGGITLSGENVKMEIGSGDTGETIKTRSKEAEEEKKMRLQGARSKNTTEKALLVIFKQPEKIREKVKQAKDMVKSALRIKH